MTVLTFSVPAATTHEIEERVIRDRHPGDGMFRGKDRHYRHCGWEALVNVALARRLARITVEPERILDFGCGFGRVGRYLRAAFPEASIVFSDVQVEACTFCADTFGGIEKRVAHDFSGYAPGEPFDLIWVGSLFTHIPAAKSRQLLGLLYGLLAPGGVLVVTTHGRYVRGRRESGTWPYAITAEEFDRLIGDARTDGYGFVPYAGANDYGISLSAWGWWEAEVDALAGATVLLYRERGWDRHQDVLAIRKD